MASGAKLINKFAEGQWDEMYFQYWDWLQIETTKKPGGESIHLRKAWCPLGSHYGW